VSKGGIDNKKQKKRVLVAYKLEARHDCVCLELLALKYNRLFAEYRTLVGRLDKAKERGQPFNKILEKVQIKGNQVSILRGVLQEITAAYDVADRMITIEDDGIVLVRKNEKEDRRRSCLGKVQYSEEYARQCAAEMQKKRERPFDAYQCRYCDHWHIGHSIHTRWYNGEQDHAEIQT